MAGSGAGFTLVELIVALGIVTVLAALLTPVVIRASHRACGVLCVNNLRGIQSTMLLYATDNEDFVVWNCGYVKRSWVSSGDYARWAPDARGCTNREWLINQRFASYADYLHDERVYKCPSDRTTVTINGRRHPWVRSYGANFIERKMTDFDGAVTVEGAPVSPAMHYTFNEPHSGYLGALIGARAAANVFIAFPSSIHNRAGGFAFADGHVELHRWKDRRTCRPLEENLQFDETGTSIPIASRGNVDAQWLAERSDSGVGYSRQDPDIMQAICQDPSLLIP